MKQTIAIAAIVSLGQAQASAFLGKLEKSLDDKLEDVADTEQNFDQSDPWATHYCNIPEENCDWESQYWNPLACECHSTYQCKKVCSESWRLNPISECVCMPNELVLQRYPAWATEVDIIKAAANGRESALARPDDWQVCPREYRTDPCKPSSYWNELACECFVSAICLVWCEDGLVSDPRFGCECVIAETVRSLYPTWATPLDITIANDDGFQYIVGLVEEWIVCPYEKHVTDCPIGQFWNELSCICFALTTCQKGCPYEFELSPESTCGECRESEELRTSLYPSWATDRYISKAMDAGYKNYKNPNGYLPICDEISCASDQYFNSLACMCFSAAQCFVGCPDDQWSFPPEPCGCTEDANQYYDLFPHWATNDQIAKSISDGLAEWSPSTNERPEEWPQCIRRSKDVDCSYYNELACTCFAQVQCALYCGEENILDPRYGCECISLDEERAIYPSWAFQYDIDLSKKLMLNLVPVDPDVPVIPPILPHKPDHLLEKPANWLECVKNIPPCDLDDHQILNELACECFIAILKCKVECREGETIDPIDGCSCISDALYRSYYPVWATPADIEFSRKLQTQTFNELLRMGHESDTEKDRPKIPTVKEKIIGFLTSPFTDDHGVALMSLCTTSVLAFSAYLF